MRNIKETLNEIISQYDKNVAMTKYWMKRADFEHESGQTKKAKEFEIYAKEYHSSSMLLVRLYAFIKKIDYLVAIKELRNYESKFI